MWKDAAVWKQRPRRADGHLRERETGESFFCFLCRGERYKLDALTMLLDACHYARGKFQRGAACYSIYARLSACAHRFYKGFELSSQWFDTGRRQLLKCEFRLRAGFFHSHAQRVASRIIKRNIFMLLKK